jgi:hypothetical protein
MHSFSLKQIVITALVITVMTSIAAFAYLSVSSSKSTTGGTTSSTSSQKPDDVPVANGTNTAYAMDYVYRYRNDTLDSFFYTTAPYNMKSYPTFRREAIVYRVFDKPIAGETITNANIIPIYRLYNSKTGTHLYTASLSEATSLPNSYSYYRNEGVVFYAYSAASTDGQPVYRLKNISNNTFLFTDSDSELDKVLTRWPEKYRYQGIAFRVEETNQDNNHVVRVMTIGHNPVEGATNLATRYFASAWSGRNVKQQEEFIFNRYVTNMSTISDGKIIYKRIHHLDISTFPTYDNGLSTFTIASYAKCVPGNPAYDVAFCNARRNAFNNVKWAQENNICKLIAQYNIDEIIMLSEHYIEKSENFMIGPTTGFNVNGGGYVVGGCRKHVVINNPVYHRPDTVMQNFAHRVEQTIRYKLAASWATSEREKYYNKFWTLQQYSGTTVTGARCGNSQFPGNTNVAFKYNATAITAINCVDFANFPSYTGATQNINCNAWNCVNHNWQIFWLGHLPSNNGTATVLKANGDPSRVYRDWWKYVLFPDVLMYG